ncbi:hypothetical protein RRG08_024647 [Elysia crispata]|uniref:Uncharacterized protein n=1 Tax=Elysia crispata TaxID=231223 RepID=A0AAE0ZWA6_9GAST|nr:hypothetical protein RRG08_024647 [Elysia crispata]
MGGEGRGSRLRERSRLLSPLHRGSLAPFTLRRPSLHGPFAAPLAAGRWEARPWAAVRTGHSVRSLVLGSDFLVGRTDLRNDYRVQEGFQRDGTDIAKEFGNCQFKFVTCMIFFALKAKLLGD